MTRASLWIAAVVAVFPLSAQALTVSIDRSGNVTTPGGNVTTPGGNNSGNNNRNRDAERELQKVRAKRQEIENSSEFNQFWAQGETWRVELLEAMQSIELDETVPAAPSSEGQDAEIAALIEKLADKQPAKRVEPRKQIRNYGAAAAIPLVKALASKESLIRISVKMILREIGPAAFGAVFPMLRNEEKTVRQTALDILMKITKPGHIGPLIKEYKETPFKDVKSGLRRVIQKVYGRPGQTEYLTYLFVHEKDRDLSNIGLTGIQRYGSIVAIPALLQASQPKDKKDREARALALKARQILRSAVRRVRSKNDVSKLYAIYKQAPDFSKRLFNAQLKYLAKEDPNREKNFKFYFYVYLKKIFPEGWNRWPR